jgi:4-amino-4-deoxy-L-arabinose transferase-like glycosyltransferase
MRIRAAARHTGVVSPGIILGIAAAAIGLGIWLHAIWPQGRVGDDFTSYAVAAHAVAQGENPYHRLVLEHAGNANPGGVAANGYVYPPLLAVLLSAPIRLGVDTHGLWLLWNLAAALVLLWMGYELNRGLRGARD